MTKTDSLPKTAYCYHCGRHQPIEEMRQLVTKTGKRWRCLESIEATKQDRKAREAFGRQMTETNKAEAQAKLRIIREAQA